MRRRAVPVDTAGLREAMARRYQERAEGTRDPQLALHWLTQVELWRSRVPVVVYLWQLPEPWRPPGCHSDGKYYEVSADGRVTLARGVDAEVRWTAQNCEPDPRLSTTTD
jgi:hypothetical protein